jgi:hypothetical protein
MNCQNIKTPHPSLSPEYRGEGENAIALPQLAQLRFPLEIASCGDTIRTTLSGLIAKKHIRKEVHRA